MHHVHADDVAHSFEAAMDHRDAAAGEDFNIVAPTALNVRGYARSPPPGSARPPTCNRSPGRSSSSSTTPDFYDSSWGHLLRNHYVSIDKARRLIDYQPRYEPETAVLESVRWLIDHQQLDVARPLTVSTTAKPRGTPCAMNPVYDYSGQVALVTGASSGMGLATAQDSLRPARRSSWSTSTRSRFRLPPTH